MWMQEEEGERGKYVWLSQRHFERYGNQTQFQRQPWWFRAHCPRASGGLSSPASTSCGTRGGNARAGHTTELPS